MKKKLKLVPHMHWDREWYFTFETSNVLLHHTFKELLANVKDQKMELDGQWSLVDDYLRWNPEDKDQFVKLLKDKKLACGPLYSQPDVYNSQGETILRNFELGTRMAKKYGVENSNTAYMPDTFGFNQNFPQLMKHTGIDNFVFWRGAPKDLMDESDIFWWEGIDGTKVKSHALKFGYFCISQHYPYTGDKIYPEKNNPERFAGKILKLTDKQNNLGDTNILPFGGDQAPFQWNQNNFFDKVNEFLPDHEIELVSSYDDFMNESNQEMPTYKGELKFPIASKIHRTIGSSRYDIKELFRRCEDNLYYLLEPLEMYYAGIDSTYSFNSYKDDRIHKPLFIAQTHDSLGACNTDITNEYQMHRLSEVDQNIFSQVDLMIKKIAIYESIPDRTMVIFNPSPFVNSVTQKKTIYSRTDETILYKSDELLLQTLESENISLGDKPLYKQEVLIHVNNAKPNSFTSISLEESNSKIVELKESKHVFINDDGTLTFKMGEKELKAKLDFIEDKGDSYDFSPGEKRNWKVTHKINNVIELLDGAEYVDLETYIKDVDQTLELRISADPSNDDISLEIKTDNKIKNTRVSMVILHEGEVQKSQSLAFSDFIKDDYHDNWKDTYHEFPAHVDINDGLISIGDLSVLTSGTNEFYLHDGGVELVLYRTYQYVTRGDMEWRPSTSGLSWKEDSEDSQLQKELVFSLRFSFQNRTKALNRFKFKPYTYKMQSSNFIANKMTKFAMNDIINPHDKKAELEVEEDKVFVSSTQIDGNDVTFRFANMENTDIQTTIKFNGKEIALTFRPYEIKTHTIKGAYNG